MNFWRKGRLFSQRAVRSMQKCVTDITELKASNIKLYVSAIFDCFAFLVCGPAMDMNISNTLYRNGFRCFETSKERYFIRRYTSNEYRRKIAIYGIRQSMNSASGRCHDNARCESMWAGMKVKLFYSRKDKPENYMVDELKTKIWRYLSYWNNRRICFTNGDLPPAVKRRRYYYSFKKAA